MQEPFVHELGDGAAGSIGGVELEEGLRPQHPLTQPPVDERANALVADVEETAHVGILVVQDPLTKGESVHFYLLALSTS